MDPAARTISAAADASRYGGSVPRDDLHHHVDELPSSRANTPERVVREATPTPDGHLIPRQTARTNGYGLVRIGGRLVRAHRVAWEVHHGRRLPRSKVVRHRCPVRACIEPTHLLAGSQRQNVVDAAKAGSLVMPYGVRLDPVLVRRLRREHARGATFAQLGRGVGRTQVNELAGNGQLERPAKTLGADGKYRPGVQPETIRFAVRRVSWAWVR